MLIASVGLHGCLFIYAIGCSIGALFVLFVQKETSGQTIGDVDVICNEKATDKDGIVQIEANRLLISEHTTWYLKIFQ